ncbi:MAG: TetR/AcrR family transcriptional regulator [Propionibacteriales bacterium]|nr:TetR/AcrR family transcriptional regulator [Propionibacteriales bacterium]
MQERLVGAAVELLLELTPADLLSAIGTRAISERAGVSQPTVFHQFGSTAAFADAVVAQVYDPGTLPVDKITEGIATIKAAGLPVEAAKMFHRADFRRLTADPGLRLRTGLWALGGGTTDAAYREFLRTTDDRLAQFVSLLWEHWGREIRPPFTTTSYVAAQVALISGLSIRHLVDPEVSTEDGFALLGATFSMTMVRAIGDQHDVADRLAEMNYYPLRSARTGLKVTGRTELTRATVMASAAELFGSIGYEKVTVAQIARKASTSPSHLYRMFGSKAGLAVALFRKQADDALASRAELSGDEVEQLVQHLVWVAEFVGTHTDHAPTYLHEVLCRKPEVERDPVVAVTAELLAAAEAASGTSAPDDARDPAELAVAAVGLLGCRVVARPSVAARDQVRQLASIIRLPVGTSPVVDR